jgi:hypothetical protein
MTAPDTQASKDGPWLEKKSLAYEFSLDMLEPPIEEGQDPD